jgi:hypothetical protein
MRGCAMTRTYQAGGWTITEERQDDDYIMLATANSSGMVPQVVTTSTWVRND